MRSSLSWLQFLLVLCLAGCGSAGAPFMPAGSTASSESSISDSSDTTGAPAARTDWKADRPPTEPVESPAIGGDSILPDDGDRVPRRRESSQRRRGRANRDLQSGTLTAGSFDDNEQFENFRR